MNNTNQQYICPPGVSILDYMRSKDIYIPAPCGGGGTCGKCRIRLRGGALSVTDADRALLSSNEINDGVRLACKAVPISPVRVELSQADDAFFIEGASGQKTDAENEITFEPSHEYGIALDIGTTTLASSLIDITAKRELITKTALNRQRAFGADVVSRIEAAANGRGEELKKIIERDILSLIENLSSASKQNIRRVVIAANTSMYNFLLEKKVNGLMAWPFLPETLGGEELMRNDVFSCEVAARNILPEDCNIKLVPGISAFVGGDITSGILACDLIQSEKSVLFIDIGTNAEMALITREGIIAASAAAGPALEGGNISCGTGSVSGAICSVESIENNSDTFTSDTFRLRTIGGTTPVGICGTGVLEAMNAFLGTGLIDSHGTFIPEFIDKGFCFVGGKDGRADIVLSQDDIRQVQMAKAAIRAGADALLRYAGVSYDNVDRLIISGGFGTYLDIGKAVSIGLIAPELEVRASAVGNTSLKGAVRFITDPEAGLAVDEIIKRAKVFDIANDTYFKERYIECMDF